jgi:hypothetical protein
MVVPSNFVKANPAKFSGRQDLNSFGSRMFFQAHLMQTAQTAACNRLDDIAERLAG